MFKNDNFKTRDFSPLIERVLAGVSHIHLAVHNKQNLPKDTMAVL